MMIGFEQYKKRWAVESEQLIKPGLEAVSSALYYLGNPQAAYPVIHIAGTNGKGSTLTFIESIALKHGLHVGKFMSPCIVDVHDQIQVDGQPISEQQMDLIFQRLKEVHLSGKLTDFELLTVIAFLHFQQEQVDLVLLETGMGGLLDSTNVVLPVVSVITSIALEHTRFLGETLEQIAFHKAGIIKRECPVVVGRVSEVVCRVIENKAANENAPLYLLGKHFDVSSEGFYEKYINNEKNVLINKLTRQMEGPHQADNMALAITAFLLASTKLKLEVSLDVIRASIADATIAGRFEQVIPSIYFDGAHNPASAKQLVATIREKFSDEKIRFVIGMLADKDVQSVLTILEKVSDDFTFVDFENSRAMEAEQLIAISKASQKRIVSISDVFNQAKQYENMITIVTGSLYLLANLRQRLIQEKNV